MAPSWNISWVMPGMVASLAPFFTALIRALVWVRDFSVGQMITWDTAMAAATGAGGSSPETERGAICISMASAPRA